MIRSYVQEHPSEWDVHLPLLTAAYRSTVHPATRFTQNFLMLGREVISPVDLAFSAAVTSMSSLPEYVEDLQSRLFNCYHLARKHLKMADESKKKNYDRIVENTYQVGDLVYISKIIEQKSLRCSGVVLMLFYNILGVCCIK